MTSSLPQDVREVFERFITCEYTAFDSRRQPIIWPVTPYYTPGAATIDVTTGLGYPKKAEDARRNPRVSLLFSDPTGSGIDNGLRVLVQGTAEVDDVDLVANRERYWRESWQKLPGTRKLHPPQALRGLFNWYYTRIYVKVRPERVFTWADGDCRNEPTVLDSHVEEVRSGHAEEPPSAALAWMAPDGFPLAVRVPVRTQPERRRVLIDADPAGLPLLEGRACLTAHAHAPDFSWQENFQVRGDLVLGDDGWALVPRKMLGGFELPDEGTLARYRRFLGKSIRFWRNARAYGAKR